MDHVTNEEVSGRGATERGLMKTIRKRQPGSGARVIRKEDPEELRLNALTDDEMGREEIE